MFYYIKGELVLLEQNTAVIDAGGVGYKMTISGTTYESLPHSPEKCHGVTLYTYLAVREDGIELFGFAGTEELNLFKLLITVSGVGPKAAISLLSSFPPQKIALAVCTDDKKTLSKASGIGPKTAARIVLELRDKLKADVSASDTAATAEVVSSSVPGDCKSEALEALLVLGYNRSAAVETLAKIDTKTKDLEAVIREALALLMK